MAEKNVKMADLLRFSAHYVNNLTLISSSIMAAGYCRVRSCYSHSAGIDVRMAVYRRVDPPAL